MTDQNTSNKKTLLKCIDEAIADETALLEELTTQRAILTFQSIMQISHPADRLRRLVELKNNLTK